jgi:signal transduction histidine kinase
MRYLRPQILLWVILPLIVALVVVSVGSINLHQQAMRDMVAMRDAQLVGLAASRLNDDFVTRRLVLQDIVRAGRLDVPDADSFDLGVGLYDGSSTPPAAVAALLITARQQPGQPAMAVADGVWIALASAGSPGNAAPVGPVAAGGISLDALRLPALLEQLKTDPQTRTYLVDAAGRPIYSAGGRIIPRVAAPTAGWGQSGATFISPPGDGNEFVIGHAPIPVAGWSVVMEEPWVDQVMPSLKYSLLAPLVVLLAAIVSLAAVYFGVRRVIRPLQTLGAQAGRVAWGDFEAIRAPIDAVGEIQDLQRVLQEMAEQIRRYQAGMQDYIAALTQAQEDERRRLARELHDDTVQSLIALSQRIKMLELDLPAAAPDAPPNASAIRVRERLGETAAMIDQALNDVRRLIRDLRPIYLEELGLRAAVEMLAESTQASGLPVTLEVSGTEQRLAANAELAVYRIAQEALTNVVRHGRATEVTMGLEYQAEGVVLTVKDDGVGFAAPESPGALAVHGHFGLIGMHERAVRLGGRLTIASQVGQGARISAFIPRAEPSDSVPRSAGSEV